MGTKCRWPLLFVLAALPLAAAGQVPSKVEWTTDLAKMKFPDAPIAGQVGGHTFKAEKAEYSSFVSTIMLRQGKESFPDESLTVFLFLKKGESPEGRKFEFGPKSKGLGPHVHVQQRKPGDKLPKTTTFTSGYALKLEFGKAKGGKLPGKIYLCLPDTDKSVAAGTFEAEMK